MTIEKMMVAQSGESWVRIEGDPMVARAAWRCPDTKKPSPANGAKINAYKIELRMK